MVRRQTRIEAVEPGDHVECQREIVDVARHGTDLGATVERPTSIETTALGAAYLAGLAVGYWKNQAEVSKAWQVDRTFEPQQSADQAAHRRARWREALSRAGDWEERTTVKGATVF